MSKDLTVENGILRIRNQARRPVGKLGRRMEEPTALEYRLAMEVVRSWEIWNVSGHDLKGS